MTARKPNLGMIVVLLMIVAGTVYAQTNVSGMISSNTTWTLAGSPYIVTGNTLVNSNVTLTIEAGVTVKFGSARTLQVDGGLIAIGTAQSRITFTANDSIPVISSWGRIQFGTTAASAIFDLLGNYLSGSILKYCDIKHGGGVQGESPYISYCRLFGGGISVEAARVEYSSIRHGTPLSFSGVASADLIVKNDTFEYNVVWGIRIGAFNNITIENCMFTQTGTAIDIFNAANSIVRNCVFTSNSAAIKGELGNATISGNTFTGHTQSVLGEPTCVSDFFLGDYFVSNFVAANLTISNNYFENNVGAIYASANYCIIEGNTFLGNHFISMLDCGGLATSCTDTFFYPNPCTYQLVEIISTPSLLNQGGLIINNVFDGNQTPANGRKNLVRVEGAWEIANNLFKNNSPGNISCGAQPNICSNKFINNSGNTIEAATGSSSGSIFVHHNEFLNNSGDGSVISLKNYTCIINNNEFQGNSSTGNPVVSISDNTATVSYNRFLNNQSSGWPLISFSRSNSDVYNNKFLNNQHLGSSVISLTINFRHIYNNDFLNNTALSCLRIIVTQPIIDHNNFVNPGVQYEMENLLQYNSSNLIVASNYWGTTSTAHIDSVIKDFFDDGNLSIALYLPVLASPVFIDTISSCFPDSSAVTLSGAIATEIGSPVTGVPIRISGDLNQIVATDIIGRYNFIAPKGGTYAVTPSKNNDVVTNNGTTSIDVLFTRRHILGTPFSTPYKIIAADVDASNSVSTLDILLMRSMILQNIATFPNGRLWSFVPSNYVFADLLNPFPFPSSRTYTNLQQSITSQDFIGIKLGDVNDSWDPSIP